MSPTMQRIAIAEACGWTHTKTINNPDETPYGRHPDSNEKWALPLPDYLNDLNAMHEAEKTLSDDNLKSYRGWLVVVCNGEHWRATAAQRAEAFLRTIDKWEETE
jgi:hypothetical protein